MKDSRPYEEGYESKKSKKSYCGALAPASMEVESLSGSAVYSIRLLITGTGCKSLMSDHSLDVDNYVLFWADRLHAIGGGKIIHVLSNIQAFKFENECLDATDDSTWSAVNCGLQKYLLVVCIYRQPHSKANFDKIPATSIITRCQQRKLEPLWVMCIKLNLVFIHQLVNNIFYSSVSCDGVTKGRVLP